MNDLVNVSMHANCQFIYGDSLWWIHQWPD